MHNNVNILNTTELAHLKMVKMVGFILCMCACVRAKSLQSCPTPCNPMDCSQPGSSVHGIPQARILQRVAMPSCREYSQPRDQPRSPALQADSLPAEPQGKLISTELKEKHTLEQDEFCCVIISSGLKENNVLCD